MIGDLWQNILVGAVIAASISYLAWRGWRTLTSSGKDGCGGCGNSADGRTGGTNDRSPVTKPFVALDSLEKPNRDQGPGRNAKTQ